jgi:hypothetical protein
MCRSFDTDDPVREYAVTGSYATRGGTLRTFSKVVEASSAEEAFRAAQSSLRQSNRRSYAGKLNMRAIRMQ